MSEVLHQEELESGVNIKTVNGQSLLGSGNIPVYGEPDAYIKGAAVADNTLTLTKKDGSTVDVTAESLNAYTKQETDAAISAHHDSSKANAATTYTKQETDSAISAHHDSSKADAATTYTKAQTDAAISAHHDSSKADAATTYTKQQTDSCISQKIDIFMPYTAWVPTSQPPQDTASQPYFDVDASTLVYRWCWDGDTAKKYFTDAGASPYDTTATFHNADSSVVFTASRGEVASKADIDTHNAANDAHSDIRTAVGAKVASLSCGTGGSQQTITPVGGVADVSPLFSSANTSLMGVVRYPINKAGTILDRNINVVSSGEFTIPAGFTDLLIRFSGTPVSLTFSDSGITDYGDDLPSESGEYLITVTKIDTDEAYIRVVTLEERT